MRHNPAIDAIRSLSILSVILLHLYIHFPFTNNIPQPIFNIIFESGYYGVIVFFVISGFLITKSILNKWGSLQAVKIKAFYCMRFARIMPCLIALIILLSILDFAGAPGFIIHTTTLSSAVFAALTFHINWLEAKTGYLPGSWDVLWTLSVEEVFYIIFPLLCLLIRNQRLFVSMLLLLIIIGPFSRTLISNEIWQDHSYFSCMDGIAFGILAALLVKNISYPVSKFFLLSGFGLFVLIFFFRHFVYLIGITEIGLNFTLLELSIALLLIAFNNNSSKLKIIKPLCWYGRDSYEIYLTHMLIITLIATFLKGLLPLWTTYSLIILGSGLLGALVEKYYSKPLNLKIRQSII